MDPAGACAQAGIPFTLRHRRIGHRRRPAVTLDQALRAVTIDAARQIGLGDRIGMLETGKEADLVILESSLCRADPGQIMGIEVSETWVAGTKARG